jgi:integrase
MARPWKHPQTGIYWLRRRVPDDLRLLLGKREEKQSLRTREPAEAKQRHAQAMAELEARWASLRRGARELSAPEAFAVAGPLYADLLAHYTARPETFPADIPLDARLWSPPPSQTAGAPTSRWVSAALEAGWLERHELQARCRALADKRLATLGLIVDAESRERVARAAARVLESVGRALQRQQRGDFGPDPDAPRYASLRGSPAAGSSSVTFASLVDGWAAEKRPSAKTLYAWRRVVDQLAAFVGHNDAARLTADDLVAWKAALLAGGLRPKTIREGKLAAVRAILQWGKDNRRLPSNVAEQVTIDVRTKPSESKRGFSDDEARLILTAARESEDPLRRWVPWIGAYTGARVAEICQLRKEDIQQHEGLWCIAINPDAGSVKNPHAERLIPVHSALAASGFFEFVRSLPDGPLFRELTPDRFGSRGGNGTKILSRWIRSMGLSDPRLSPSHSWRHRMRTLARRYGLAADITDAITGHRRRTVADRYGEFPVETLARELARIPDLDAKARGES